MRRIITVILACVIIMLNTGCSENKSSVNVNVEKDNTINGKIFGEAALIKIGDYLWYDTTTHIVYWWTGSIGASYSSTVPSPYYAPNGFPYRYNPETNTFEEISQ